MPYQNTIFKMGGFRAVQRTLDQRKIRTTEPVQPIRHRRDSLPPSRGFRVLFTFPIVSKAPPRREYPSLDIPVCIERSEIPSKFYKQFYYLLARLRIKLDDSAVEV